MKKRSQKGLLLRGIALLVLLSAILPARAQERNYVFYNYSSDIKYLYNDNGTAKSDELRFDKSSLWIASDQIGGTNRTIRSYTDGRYLGANAGLSNNTSNWRGANNFLCYRNGNTNYYLKATNATTFTTNSNQNNGNRYYYYEVTNIEDITAGINTFSISGNTSISATGSYNYSHTDAKYYSEDYTNYYFSSSDHYVNRSNVTVTSDPGTTVTSGSAYNWSLSDNATGYATVDPSTGEVTVSTIPDQKLTFTLTCTCTYNNQIATASININIQLTGVAGGIVTLDDREDHNWSYYQPLYENYDNYPRRMCSPYPRNVKITYYGYGENTLSTSEVAEPAAGTFTTNTTSSDVKVGIGEDGHTFIYYKTLERDANNRFPYELIPNPFYVRPKSGTTYTGFYKWRIKSISNGAVYDASSGGASKGVGSMLDAEETYYFQPTNNAWSNANNVTSMEIELEALWAPAEVITGNTFSMGYNSVERNFRIVSNDAANTLDAVKIATPCTYTSFYPNGTTNGTTEATLGNRNTRRSTFTPTADSKVEYMLLNGNTNTYNINADAHNLTLGRGIGTAAGANYSTYSFYPVDADKNTALDFKLRIESGVYFRAFLMSNGHTYSRRFQNHFTFGSDYDRAKGDNEKLDMSPAQNDESRVKYGTAALGEDNKDKPTLTCVIKSGQFQKTRWTDNNNAQYNYGIYCCGDCDNTSYPGISSLTVEGGHISSIIGGRGNYTVGCITEDSLTFTLRFKGGLVENSVYGASSNNATYGSRRLIFTGGEVRGWIAAGCNGTSDTDERGQTRGDSYVYVGGNTKVGNADHPRTNNSAVGGNVYGAGRGGNRQYASIKISHVAVADNAEVLHDVYGGGFHGHIVTTSNVFVLGGTTHGRVFGGGDNNGNVGTVNRSIPTVNITMTDGLVEGGIYGGSNTTGIVTDLVNMKIDGGQVGASASNTANIHGGGLGENTVVNGNVSVTLGTTNQTTSGVTVYGNVYGGSALGDVNTNNTNTTTVTMNKALINGNLFGGALGASADVNGKITVTIAGGTVNGNVFGGGDAAAYSPNANFPVVNMTGGTVTNIFGGGNGDPNDATQETAKVTGNPQVTLSGNATVTGNVYGGGNAAKVEGNTNVMLKD